MIQCEYRNICMRLLERFENGFGVESTRPQPEFLSPTKC